MAKLPLSEQPVNEEVPLVDVPKEDIAASDVPADARPPALIDQLKQQKVIAAKIREQENK